MTLAEFLSLALSLLAVICLSTGVSIAQSTNRSSTTATKAMAISDLQKPASPTENNVNSVLRSVDPFTALPVSDAVVVIDLKRILDEALARLLEGENEARSLVIALTDVKSLIGLDTRSMQRAVLGLRYGNPQSATNRPNVAAVAIVQSTEAERLPALLRPMGNKVHEEQYGGKVLYVGKSDQGSSEIGPSELPITVGTNWAIVALDSTTIVFGDAPQVRSSIDVNAGRGTRVNSELIAAANRNPKALISTAGLLAPSVMAAGQQFANSDVSRALSSLKQVYTSIELTPTVYEVSVMLNTAGPQEAKTVTDVLAAFKTLTGSLAPGKTRQDEVFRTLIKGLVLSTDGADVQIRAEISQASINQLAKIFAGGIYFSRGVAQMYKGDPEAAIADYDKSILLDPESVLTFINRGKAKADKGNLDAAIADYDKAISMGPDTPLAYNNRCFARIRKEDFGAAIADCDKAIALDPGFAFAYNNRGLALAGQGNFEKAMADYDKSIALDAENVFAYKNRGNLRLQNEAWDGAIADFDKVVSLDPNSAEAYSGRGLARYNKGELDQAIADYDKAISFDPKSAIVYNNRGLALAESGHLDKAMADYDKSIELNGKNGFSYQNRGSARTQKGDWNGAIADYDKALNLDPKSPVSYNGRGLARFNKGDLDQAIADYDKAIALDPNPVIYVNRGYAQHLKGNLDGAIADFDKALTLNSKSEDAYNGRGLIRHQKGDFDQAIADFDSAIVINPDFAEAYGNRAISRLALSRDAEAEQDLKKCFQLDESLRTTFEDQAREVKKSRPAKPRNHH